MKVKFRNMQELKKILCENGYTHRTTYTCIYWNDCVTHREEFIKHISENSYFPITKVQMEYLVSHLDNPYERYSESINKNQKIYDLAYADKEIKKEEKIKIEFLLNYSERIYFYINNNKQ